MLITSTKRYIPRIIYKKQYPKYQYPPTNPTNKALTAMAAIALFIGFILYCFVIKITMSRMISVVKTQMEFVRAIVP